MKRLYQYALLMRLHRPIGILLLLWPTLWALWIAGQGYPDVLVTTVFVLGVIIMRSAGCVINDYADRHIDPYVRRTHDRPLAAKRVTTREALTLFIILCLLAFGLVLLMNLLTIILSVIAALLAASYPFMKRYTHWPQVYLGVAFGWSIPMAFAAQTDSIPTLAWWLLLTNVLWTVAYDTMYAMVDRADDLAIGVKSTAILFGQADKAIIASLQIVVLLLLLWIGIKIHLGTWYYLGLLVAAGLVIYQQWLIKDRDPQRCFQAFLNNNWFGATIFAGIAAHYYWG
ncbi:MAG: 4-hydroxybenzoate octaprenyltransferase [Gammaproteobacteria bacterium]|nr:MAG: 4-hydroxybenzoate octaprenyltransferase [Gammaproteobacteria bacterium]RKZ42773.1 MAG: 4-hydroxybenzoate octaprenyltransferase [Gammaproteobacteria bacterium]RKZ77187.1 MAG: 4-hydroxybenzoate octaprenyltransferase [Gammaproteobacteria bacterium]